MGELNEIIVGAIFGFLLSGLPLWQCRVFFRFGMADKLTEEVTVKLSQTVKRFISTRSKQQGMESFG